MPIKKQATIPSGSLTGYHVVTALKVDMKLRVATVHVVSYYDEASYLDGKPVVWNWDLDVPMETVGQDLEAVLTANQTSPFFGGDVTSDKTETLETIKARKNAEINRARLAANRTSFPFQGKQIAFDELSQLDISTTNGGVALRGAMPSNWAGGWKAVDNTYVAIPDVETWKQFYEAIEAQGTANFMHAQDLKTKLQAAETAEEVDAIVW